MERNEYQIFTSRAIYKLINNSTIKGSIITITSFLCLFGITQAQAPKKDITPTSPEAAALTKMINFPVNFNTGLPNIAVPLYQVESGNLKLPIGISYHSGGFKINEQSTSVGLGWSLTSDIQITRSVNGLDDFKPLKGYLANAMMKTFYKNPGTCPSCDYPFNGGIYTGANTNALAMGNMDGMPDKFSYKLLNKSGSFYFAKSNNGSSYFILPIPYDNIQISYNGGQFIIVDTDGTTYYFGSAAILNPANLASQGFETTQDEESSESIRISAWKCKQIINATNTESINFAYQAKAVISMVRPIEKIDYYSNDDPCKLGIGVALNNEPFPVIANETYGQLLSRRAFYALSSPKYMVNFGNNAVFYLPYKNTSGQFVNKTFSLDYDDQIKGMYQTTSRQAISGLTVATITFRGGSVTFNGADKLSSIVVKNTANQQIKNIAFFSSYTSELDMSYPRSVNGNSFNGSLYLDSVKIAGSGIAKERYVFQYNQKTCFGNHLTGSDAWGYYNQRTRRADATGETNVPYKSITQRFYMSTGTNGTCSDYIDNVIFNIGNINDTEGPDETKLKYGMLTRIIYPTGGYTDFDFESNLYKESRSDAQGSHPIVQRGGGLRIRAINAYDGKTLKLQSQKYYRYGDTEDGIGLIMNAPPRNLNNADGRYEGYSYKQNIIYYRNPNSNLPANSKISLTAWLKETKTTYMTVSSLDYSFPTGSPIYYTKVTEYNNDMGEQTGKKVYVYYPPNPFGGNMKRDVLISNTNIPALYADDISGDQKAILDYKYENGLYQLVHAKEFTYLKYEKAEQARVAYAYMNNTYQSTPGGAINSNIDIYNTDDSFGSTLVPVGADYNYSQYGIGATKLLLQTETEKWVNNGNVLTQTTAYSYNKLPYLQPDTVTTTKSTGEVIEQTIKYAYDFPGVAIYDQMRLANVNMIAQPVDVKVTDVSHAKELSRTLTNYAIAGASPGFIAPVSVESSTHGDPLKTEITFLYNDNGNVTQITGKNGLIKSYLWGYNYLYPIAEFTGVDYATAMGSTNVSNLQNTTDEASLRTILTALRNSNASAMVSTFTYNSLIGVSSQTAANGQDKFYEYDDFGRLLTIKDHSLNILNRYEYKYRPLNINAPMYTSFYTPNVPVMATFKQECATTPVTFRSLNYIVPGGIYFYPNFEQANSNAETALFTQGPNQGFGTDGLPLAQMSVINLSAFMFSAAAAPSNVYIDLIQDDNVVSSSKFPYVLNGTADGPTNQFYVKNGTYKLSFRQSALNGISILKYAVNVSDGTSFWVKDGDTMLLKPGFTYRIQITNAF
jgi:hypothetical protein